MCTIAAAGLVIALGSTALATYEQNQNVKAQNNFNQRAAEEGSALADASFKNQSIQMRTRDQQEADATSAQLQTSSKRAAEARATTHVSAGESGVAGVSVDSLIADYYGQEAGFRNTAGQNLEWNQNQSNAELLGLQANATDHAIASRRPLINPPSYLAAGITAAGQGLDVYNRYSYAADAAKR